MGWNYFLNIIRLWGCQVILNTRKEFVKVVDLESIIDSLFQKELHEEPRKHLNSFTRMFVDLWLHFLMANTSTSSYSLMILLTWVFFMKQKSNGFTIFSKFKSFIQKQNGNCIKILRSDSGKEYRSREFHKFCEDEGVGR